ncbi:MAG: hypothetical protein ACPHDO_04080, partial [Candidatus Poseidoniaceae archaeon]
MSLGISDFDVRIEGDALTDSEYIVDRLTNSFSGLLGSLTIPQYDAVNHMDGGILTRFGIDLGQVSYEFYESYLQIFFNRNQDNVLLSKIGQKGSSSAMSQSELTHFSNTDVRSISPEKKSEVWMAIQAYLWKEANKRSTIIQDKIVSGIQRTMLISWLYDYGFVNARKFERLINVL